MKIFFFFLLINLALNAYDNDKYSMRLAYGFASNNDSGQISFDNSSITSKDLYVLAVDGGYLLKKDFMDLPIDIYLKGGVSYFDEDVNNNTYEVIAYIKALYNVDFLDNKIRFGLGEGGSYTTSILEVEYDDVHSDSNNISNTSKFLNYLDITVDFDLGKLINYKPMKETYVGYLLKHRSGIFGLINNVDHGGSNYNSFYVEKNF